jgi:DNA-binding transcriptional regulator YiaG
MTAKDSPSPRGIQLLGFSQRHIKVLRSDIPGKLRYRKPCPTTVKTFGEQLRVRRLELRLTQPEMAAKLGVSKFRLGLWERGVAKPTDAQHSNLVTVLGVAP